MYDRLRGPAAPTLAAAVLAGLLVAGCGKQTPQAEAAGPPEVGVVTLAMRPLPLATDLPGRTAAYRVAEVRPQVNGIVLKRLFTEGGQVKAGEQLYQIDPAIYQATYNSQKAALARAEAQYKTAALLAERYAPLAKSRAVSQQDYDDARARRDQAQADVLAARAALDTARINLVYTKVLSPIDGIVGRSAVTEGALVTANQAGALASVQQIDPIYVDVVQSSTQLLQLQRDLASGRLQRVGSDQARVMLTLGDGSQYEHAGTLQFSEVTVDPGTDAVTLRAVFPNPDHRLLPGMFVHALLQQGVDAQALLVPQQAVARNQRGEPSVLVVGPDDKISQRAVTAERAIGDAWHVTAGLKAGERVVVDGLQRVRPGDAVKPVETRREPDAAAAPGAAPMAPGAAAPAPAAGQPGTAAAPAAR